MKSFCCNLEIFEQGLTWEGSLRFLYCLRLRCLRRMSQTATRQPHFFEMPMADKNIPHGLAPKFIGHFSGQVTAEAVEQSVPTLPTAIGELRNVWHSIDTSRTSGFMPVFEGCPLDDGVRNGTWHPLCNFACRQ